MGYNLTIGEAVLAWDEDYVCVDAQGVTLPNAPAFGECTDHTNNRMPSYSVWADFCRNLDIVDLMYNERNGGAGCFEWNGKTRYPLISSHSGTQPVTVEHVEYVEAKLAAYKAKHPDHIAEYPPPKPGAKPIFGDEYRQEDLVDDPRYDGNLVRGEWLAFWLRWAVENCKQPVFRNT